MKFRFIEDPGHSWLEIPRKFLYDLGIAGQISQYSYQRGEMVYLEEDCDAYVFLQTMKDLGRPVETESVYQDPTPIRRYQRFAA